MGCDSRKSSDPIKPDKFLVFPGSKIPVPGSANVRQESTGKNVVFGRKAPEHPGKWKQHSGRKIFKFFSRCFPANFLFFPSGNGRKSPKKIRKISDRNTASIFRDFPVFSHQNQPVFVDLCFFQIHLIPTQVKKSIPIQISSNFVEIRSKPTESCENILVSSRILY